MESGFRYVGNALPGWRLRRHDFLDEVKEALDKTRWVNARYARYVF